MVANNLWTPYKNPYCREGKTLGIGHNPCKHTATSCGTWCPNYIPRKEENENTNFRR